MTTEAPRTRLHAIATAVPEWAGSQATAERFLLRVLEESVKSASQRDRAIDMTRKIYAKSGIERRHSVIADFLHEDPREFDFFPSNWELEPFPTTARRMKLYEKTSVDLAAEAARRALEEADISPEEVTHLLIGSCTGFFAPGPDVLLQHQLRLSPAIHRAIIGFMGCHAGFNLIRAADQIVRGRPEAIVLAIAVELCSIHFQKKPVPSLLVANCLFSDGCGAVVCGSEGSGRRGIADVLRTHSRIERSSLHQMTWRIGDHGFEMRLSPDIPDTLEALASEFARELLLETGLDRGDVAGWALHPGGRKILEALERALDLEDTDLAASFRVLRDYGNMSSSTIFFVLRELFHQHVPDGPVAALGFGPGLTTEGLLLQPLMKRRD